MNRLKCILILFVILVFHYELAISQNSLKRSNDIARLEKTGDILQHAIPISVGLITLLEKDYDGTKQFVFSYTTTIIISYSLKSAIAKRRPKQVIRFDSFPSGHTAAGFSGASFLHRRYGWKCAIPAYALASIIGISRVEGDHHDYWDVLGGAIVGIGSTYMFATPYQQEHFKLGFDSEDETYLLTFTYSF